MPIINVHIRITLWLFILLVYCARSEEISTTKNVDNADLKSRLSTVLPFQSLNDDKHIIKNNPKRSLVLLMPLSQTQNEREKLKETVEKTKRCDTHRKNRLPLLSTKKDRNNRVITTDKNINVGTSKQNSNSTIKDANSLEKSKITSKRTLPKAHEDEMFLQVPKDNLSANDVIVNLKSQERAKKCNTEKCICHCKEENCFPSSSKENSLRTSSFSEINKSVRPNNRRIKIFEGVKPDNLQQKLSTFDESSHESPFPNLINQFSAQPYQERIKILSIPILYGVIPNVPPYVVENEGKYINVGIPFTSFEDRPNYLVEKNQLIDHKNPCTCSSVINEQGNKNSMPVASSSENYVDVTTTTDTTSSEPDNLISQTEENREHDSKLITKVPNVDSSIDSNTEINLLSDYSVNTIEASTTMSPFNLNKITPKTEDFTNQIEENSETNLFKFETSSEDSLVEKDVPSFIYGINDETLIDIEECIQLYGHNVCVLSAKSPKKFPKLGVQKIPSKYSTVKIPEYITQTSVEKKTMLNNIDHLDKLKTTSSHLASKSFNGIDESNVDLINKYAESTTTKLNTASLSEFHQYPESAKQIPKPDVKYDEIKSFSKVNTHTLINPIIDETAKKEKIKLGKSKSQTIKLLLNSNTEEIESSTLNEGFHYSTLSYKSSSDRDTNNLQNQQNPIINDNSKAKYDSKEQNRKKYPEESNTGFYFEKKISQEHLSNEITTMKSNTENNFNREAKINIIGTTVHPEEISQEQSTTMEYFNNKKSNKSSCKEDITCHHETPNDSSTNRLPFCDNTLLLNSIRKIINDFALNPRLNKIKDLDKNILQIQGKSLLPEILEIPNLKNILSVPRIENMIVEKVKDVLSRVTSISKKDFTNDWSHGVIKNTLHSILDAFSGIRHKLPPITLEEHQFKNGQWGTKLVTLAPISKQKSSKGIPETLRESIKNLLGSPAIASQVNNHIVQNMIVESVKNNLANDGDDQTEDSIIQVLNNILQTLKSSEDTNALEKSSEIISDKDVDITSSENLSTNNYEIEIEGDVNSTLINKQNLDRKKDKSGSKTTQIMDYQKVKILENDVSTLTSFDTTSEFSPLLELLKKKEETTNKPTAKIKENKGFKQIKNINVQNITEKKLPEPKITYYKAISQNNPNVLAIPESNFTRTEQYGNNYRIDEETVKDTTIANFIQETSPNYAQESNDTFVKNMEETKYNKENVKHTSNEYTSITSTEINPLIILERIKFNLPPTKYYSPKILKYMTNHQNDDKSIEIPTIFTSFTQETSTNYAQTSNDLILQNETDTKNVEEDEIKVISTTSRNNFISSTNNTESEDYKPKMVSLTNKNILESQQNPQQSFAVDNIKIQEVTTEVQQTYPKTTYFGAKEATVSSTESFAKNNIESSQLIPSSVAPDNMSELLKSQLYYVGDGIKLPLEIKRMEDGSYALSISKNICEQILTRKCPCCVPLQGYIVQPLENFQQEENMHATTLPTLEMENQDNKNDIMKYYHLTQPLNTIEFPTLTKRNALKTQKSKEREEKINSNYLQKKTNNDNLPIISMPVADFLKKYNLILNFNKDETVDKSSNKSEEEQSVIKTINKLFHKSNDTTAKFQEMKNIREKKNTSNINPPTFPIIRKFFNLKKNSKELEVRKPNAEINQSKIGQKIKMREANNTQNINVIQKIKSENQEGINPVLKKINTSEESKKSSNEIKRTKKSNITAESAEFLRKKEDKELEAAKLTNDNKYNVPRISHFNENLEKPYRFQRNTNNVRNKGTELVKSMLYWFKNLFTDK